jgi:hypothetical protein
MWPKIVNAKGQEPNPALVPADVRRCQAYPNTLGWSFMTLGPKPKPIRCDAVPVCIVVEDEADEEGIGSMSLCAKCLVLFKERVPNKSVTVIMKKGL